MKNTSYKNLIHSTNSFDELNQLKNDFLNECEKREKRITTSNLLKNITSFGGAKAMFESLTPALLPKKGGKTLINKYVKVIRENNSLKTLYTYCEGLKANATSDMKKAYITEALSLSKPIVKSEYNTGLGQLMNVLAEAFTILGDDYILENVTYNKKADIVTESLIYLSTSKKSVKNLNEYFMHMDNASELINETTNTTINANKTLSEIVSEMNNTKVSDIDGIFATEDKQSLFRETKESCLNLLIAQKNNTDDTEVARQLTEMENKLRSKSYNFDTFTKDMLYMTELQEVLK